MTVSWDLNALSLAVVQKIDDECSRFESQLQADRGPRIESSLNQYSGAERKALLQELLILELQYLVRNGVHPRKEDYCQRFQDDFEVIASAFEWLDAQAPGRDGEPTVGLSQASQSRIRAAWSVPHANCATQRYKDRLKHAHGGMGEVFTAIDSLVGRRVALKRLRQGRHGSQERFVAEAQITGQLEHP